MSRLMRVLAGVADRARRTSSCAWNRRSPASCRTRRRTRGTARCPCGAPASAWGPSSRRAESGRSSKPSRRSRMYRDQLMPLPNSPSLTMSIPTSACLATTSATERRRHVRQAPARSASPTACAFRRATNSGGRTRLPTCVVRMRSVRCGHRAPGGPGAVLVSMPPDRSGHLARQRRATEVTRRDVARSGGLLLRPSWSLRPSGAWAPPRWRPAGCRGRSARTWSGP